MTLISAGVEVTIVNEAFHGSSGAGTIPLFLIATAANKAAPSGTGLSPQTLAGTAGQLYLATSQRDLVQSFGNPIFHSSGGTPLHGHELNEYGLHAAYSYLGASNQAYILRADLDLSQLEPSVSPPTSPAVTGTYWLDLSNTRFGLFQSNGNVTPGLAWAPVTNFHVCGALDIDTSSPPIPKTGFGANGDFAVVPETTSNLMYEKTAGVWNLIGSTAWKTAHPTVLTAANTGTYPVSAALTLIIAGITVTVAGGGWANVAAAISAINATSGISAAGITATSNGGKLVLTNANGTDIVIGAGTANTVVGLTAATTKGVTFVVTNDAQYPANVTRGNLWVKLSSPNLGASWSVKRFDGTQWTSVKTPFYVFDSTLTDGNVSKDAAALAAMTLTTGVIYIGYDAAHAVFQLRRYNGTAFAALSYQASLAAPTTKPQDGTYWYNSSLRVDVMVGNGTHWNGYLNRFPSTDPLGVIIAGSAPVTQSSGANLVDNDLWLDSSDLENYPKLYRFSTLTSRWKLIDNTDQTTPFGVVFADARANSGTTVTGSTASPVNMNSELITDLLASDYLDPDAPDPRLYPDGVLLFNTRYSNYNVKIWRPLWFTFGGFDVNTDFTTTTYHVGASDYTFATLADAGRWVTASGNDVNGSPLMGRKAQRIMVVRALAEAVTANQDIRSEIIFYNLMAAPGYPELIDELDTLNTDQKEVAFIVADTPIRLLPSGLAIQQWATNALAASGNGEIGLTSASPYVGVYYPWGLSTNVDGTDIMVPPSTIAMRTLAYNDQVSHPWQAPAGYQRGLVSNATAVGYLNLKGEFKSVVLNQGQRDVLYTNKVNPIAFMNGAGLVVYGQKTLDPTLSALDRVNVARLVNYLKYNIDNLVKPFIFQPNDSQTRAGAALAVTRFLAGLVGLRALEDFAVLCDETNNTPERRDRNELWIDIAVIPIKSVEFIYIPVRIEDSGAKLTF